MKRRTIYILLVFVVTANAAIAQKDTGRKQTIDITSAYKPVLRNAVKINFSAAQLNADTSKPNLAYNIPVQNLFYSYQPITLKPLALQQDTNLYLGLRNFIKAGFGNFSTPYVSAGFSFGDGRSSLMNLYADYISSKGKIKYQDFTQLNLKARATFFGEKNETYLGAALNQSDYYLYGYDHAVYNYKKDSLRQRFQDITLTAGIKNKTDLDAGLSYHPNVQVNLFTNQNKLSESNLVVTVPVKAQFGNVFAVGVDTKADITSYTSKNLATNVKFSNNVFQVSPYLAVASPRFSIHAGITPTWDNGKFVWLPNVYAEAQLQEKVFLIQAGWVGNYTKNTYRHLSSINPYLNTIKAQLNTKEIEYYGGIKATVGKHFNFSAKAGFITYTNLPLFINDTATDNKSFVISNETKANNFRIHADISYINQDKFTLTGGLTFNGYTGLQRNAKAWHTIPMEITSSLRWWAFKQVLIKSDLYVFAGGNYLKKGNAAGSFSGGTDLSAGMEFRINKMFSAWMDVNNVLNNKYQRWHNYEVYGLNLMGGVRVSF